MAWAYGAFFDELDEMGHTLDDDNQGFRLVGRMAWTPRYDTLSEGRYLFHTGIAYAMTQDQDDRVRFRSRPEIHRGSRLIDTRLVDGPDFDSGITSTDDIATGLYHTFGAELAWVHGPLSIQSEWIWTSINDVGSGTTDLFGAYVYASYFLTGEHRPYDRTTGVFDGVVPYENFWMVNTPRGRRAGWGAWELAARWSHLDFSQVEGQQLHDLTVGVNWHWSPNTRLIFNWIHTFVHRDVGNVADTGQGDILATRLQVTF